MNKEIETSLNRLKLFIEKENYRGYDPYDALHSPLLNLPLIKGNKSIRFLSQQLVKRSPFNLRPLLRIKKGLNPVTLGLCIQGYVNMGASGLISRDEAEVKCSALMNNLEALMARGYSGACWGYDFPWESRHFTLGPLQPSVVATGIITNALFRYYRYSQNNNALDLCKSACDFILNDLNRFEDAEGRICFSYTPFDHYRVYNASMKGVRTLAQVYSVTGANRLYDSAKLAAGFTAANQNADGSWFYAAGDKGKWIDNYHTGYVLECLSEYSEKTGDSSYDTVCRKGFDFYVKTFFENDRIPKFFSDKKYPLDCTSGAQAIITLCRFGKAEMAGNVAAHLISNMQSVHGGFYFRKYRIHTAKTPFMRWSDAWMFAALSGIPLR